MPFWPPTTRTWLIVTSVVPRRRCRPRRPRRASPTRCSRPSITSGPWWTPAERCTTGGRSHVPERLRRRRGRGDRGADERARAGRARRRPPRTRAARAAAARGRAPAPQTQPAANRRERDERAGRGRRARGRAAMTAPSSSSPSGRRSPAGLVAGAAGGRRGRARARRDHRAGELDRPPARERGAERRTAASERREERREAATRAGLSACTTSAQEGVGSVARARERVGGRDRPTGRRRRDGERARAVGERRNRGVGREHDPAVDGLEPVLVDEPAEQRIVAVAAQEAGRADRPGRRR